MPWKKTTTPNTHRRPSQSFRVYKCTQTNKAGGAEFKTKGCLNMCFVVACKQCGKSGWGGCGRHLPSVYASIQKGNHCLCRPWPGITTTTSDQPLTGNQAKGASSATTATVLIATLALMLIAYFTM